MLRKPKLGFPPFDDSPNKCAYCGSQIDSTMSHLKNILLCFPMFDDIMAMKGPPNNSMVAKILDATSILDLLKATDAMIDANQNNADYLKRITSFQQMLIDKILP